eukprot:TRINITY_DN22915_c0_g1_i1.p1 TRINITY_DN22915_c0_g1~~TRINITY_DN22915_c0_g1_i1.p1  ORF type:complete len:293 (+),score=80.09 TRINITY_DN22915_c0_g1_i1:215-1093(+)
MVASAAVGSASKVNGAAAGLQVNWSSVVFQLEEEDLREVGKRSGSNAGDEGVVSWVPPGDDKEWLRELELARNPPLPLRSAASQVAPFSASLPVSGVSALPASINKAAAAQKAATLQEKLISEAVARCQELRQQLTGGSAKASADGTPLLRASKSSAAVVDANQVTKTAAQLRSALEGAKAAVAAASGDASHAEQAALGFEEAGWQSQVPCWSGPHCFFLARGICQYYHPPEHSLGHSADSAGAASRRRWNVFVNPAVAAETPGRGQRSDAAARQRSRSVPHRMVATLVGGA